MVANSQSCSSDSTSYIPNDERLKKANPNPVIELEQDEGDVI